MLLRFEDTDVERSRAEYEDDILDGLSWLGIKYDNKKVERQSARGETYKKYIEKLIADGYAYISKEKSKQNESEEVEVVRFKNPKKIVSFDDLVRGKVEFDTTELEDFVIARAIDKPLYHLSVVVDDFENEVSHVIRGEDHISNTPRQILIQEAIGAPRPVYAHIPLILAPDRSKLSKRHGAVSLSEYRNMGYLPEAMVNYLALLGFNPGTDDEIFGMSELIKKFDIKRVQKSGAIFDINKLNWLNKEYLKRKGLDELSKEIGAKIPEISGDLLMKLVPIILERINKYADIDGMRDNGDIDYYFKNPSYDARNLIWKKSATGKDGVKEKLNGLIKILGEAKDKDFSSSDNVKDLIFEYAEKEGRGDVLWAMRYALSGKEKSPDPFTLAYILGKNETLERLSTACRII